MQSLSTRQRGFPRVSLLQLYFSQKATQGGGVRARPQRLTALTPTSLGPQARRLAEGLLLLQAGDGRLEHRRGELGRLR